MCTEYRSTVYGCRHVLCCHSVSGRIRLYVYSHDYGERIFHRPDTALGPSPVHHARNTLHHSVEMQRDLRAPSDQVRVHLLPALLVFLVVGSSGGCPRTAPGIGVQGERALAGAAVAVAVAPAITVPRAGCETWRRAHAMVNRERQHHRDTV